MGRRNLIGILMLRDEITEQEANQMVEECKHALENGDYDAIGDYLGLEDDYIFDVLGV